MGSLSAAAVQIDSLKNAVTEGHVGVEMKRTVTETTYLLFIDLSNSYNAYRHVATNAIRFSQVSAELIKENASAQWESLFGIVLAIDGIEATIAWCAGGSLRAYGSDSFLDRKICNLFPVIGPVDVEAGDLKYIANNFKQLTTNVNTNITLKDIEDNDVAPAVGDVVLKAERLTGIGDADIHYTAFYYTV